jgi:hypothetical protein
LRKGYAVLRQHLFEVGSIDGAVVPKAHQLVLLLLSFPAFHLSHALFQPYSLHQRRMLLLRRKCLALGIDDRGASMPGANNFKVY